ncbi:MAG TPA: VOC family protein [Sideroxyarcus sp.]|nr:VOC family protein [Sideroxyarcus sp.]
MQKIIPFLWFNDQAEEAANHYVSIFKNSKVTRIDRYQADSAEVSGRPDGSVMTVTFELDGQTFTALNGGPVFKFSEAISFVVNCDTQAEVDELWRKLTAGGEEIQCGWLKDKFGVSWQIVPTIMDTLLRAPNPAKASKVWQAMLTMKKIDIAALQRAHDTA